ncbi:endothelin-1 [Clinocottus analis]|uniref:endothelin-1 n=1 Tax=Clinocottus analis TaxID=304258 RepID=UPI0035C23FC2
MDIYIVISALSVMYSWIMCTVLSAPAGETPAASTDNQLQRHVRTKRCSCATFMDNECVYFCHLDIIWVNTPERVVAYGLGNAPRTRRALSDPRSRRALPDSGASGTEPRCQCVRHNDVKCRNFCRIEKRPRYDTSRDAGVRSAGADGCAQAQCKPQLADTGRIIKRTRNGDGKRVSPLAFGAALRTRLLLEKWRARQRHRARAPEGRSAAS